MSETQVESPTITPSQSIETIAALRDKVAAMTPNIVPELLKGDSLEALITSLDESRAAYDRIVANATPAATPTPPAETPPAETKPEAPAVPAGAASYTEDLNKIPAHELIRRGLKQRAAANAQ